ncbi:MAG: UDP-N-acetylmuramate dehydrogenase [Pedosphaera sp.]|nr:UDP-N-acetylmuramate dehydrogenase [Pedosphaera sp.]
MTETATITDCPMPKSEHLADELKQRVSPATTVRANEPLARRTTLRVGGPADVFVEPASEEDLAAVLRFCAESGEKFFVLGRGSNLIVRDGGFRGVVISLAHAHFSRIETAGDRLLCGAGAKLRDVAHAAKRQGLSGVEFLEGIPGSVGGALRMNAGAMGGATFDAVESVRFMAHNGTVLDRPAREVPVEYRCCPLFKTHIALEVLFRCAQAPREEIEARMNAFSQKRWATQPAASSAGCMFKNPAAIPAGKLVEELGLKGTRVGGAMVSHEHGNFIVNDGKATARNVLELIALLKERVRAARGVELHAEVEIIGDEI